MNRFRILPGLLAVVLAAFASAPQVRAGDINGPAMAGLVLNNTIPDCELYVLSLFAGTSTDVLNTKATDTTTGFTETLSGTYAGQALSVTYTGDTTMFPGGAVTWTSTGTYGAQAWNGSGSATFVFPTANTAEVIYSSTVTIGANTVVNNSTIYGSDNGTWFSYYGVTGTISINGMNPIPAPQPTQGTILSPIVGDLGYDDYEVNGRVTITSLYEICDEEDELGYPYSPTLIKSAGTVSFVPEPSSLVLTSIGILGAFAGYASGRVRKTGV
jgi:hypothetical protein